MSRITLNYCDEATAVYARTDDLSAGSESQSLHP
jgi:hypothetical protein